jgi:transcriptional regulator with XRE-family HTH domain
MRVAREAAGLKKVDVARETGLSLSYIGRIENGKSHPSRLALQAVGLALGVEPDWLAQGKGEQTSKRGEISRDSYLAKRSAPEGLDIERHLLGTPLLGAFSRVPRSIRQKWTISWQMIPDQRKTEVRRIVAAFANAAVVLDQLPAKFAEPLHRQFEKQLRAYAASVFDSPSERGAIR